jgi:hypothetical protein
MDRGYQLQMFTFVGDSQGEAVPARKVRSNCGSRRTRIEPIWAVAISSARSVAVLSRLLQWRDDLPSCGARDGTRS